MTNAILLFEKAEWEKVWNYGSIYITSMVWKLLESIMKEIMTSALRKAEHDLTIGSQ